MDLELKDKVVIVTGASRGMGPADPLQTTPGKVLASLYALYSGVVLLASVGVLAAPLFHRFMHRFHLQNTE